MGAENGMDSTVKKICITNTLVNHVVIVFVASHRTKKSQLECPE